MNPAEIEQQRDPRAMEIARIKAVYADRERSRTEEIELENRGTRHIVHEYRSRLLRLLRLRSATPLPQCRVLDLGCGHGSLLAWLGEQGAKAGNLVGVDLVPERIASARRRYPELTFFEGDG